MTASALAPHKGMLCSKVADPTVRATVIYVSLLGDMPHVVMQHDNDSTETTSLRYFWELWEDTGI